MIGNDKLYVEYVPLLCTDCKFSADNGDFECTVLKIDTPKFKVPSLLIQSYLLELITPESVNCVPQQNCGPCTLKHM